MTIFTVINTNDSGAGSLRQAILDSNAAGGSNTIEFDAALIGQTITTISTLPVSVNAVIDGDITIEGSGTNSLIELDTAGVDLTLENVTLNQVATELFTPAVIVTNDNISITNNASITATGPNSGSDPMQISDRTNGIDVQGDNFTLVNQAGASIVTTGRIGVQAISFDENYFATVINDGLIEGSDDGVRLTSGVITNSGTIRSTGLFSFGFDGAVVGLTADAVQFFGPNTADFVTPADGIGVVNNLASGIIEGVRSGVFLSGNGILNNAGIITADVATVISSGGNIGTAAPLIINNSGTITRNGGDFGLNVDPAAILLGDSAVSSEISITNSGTINSVDVAISITSGGATVVNELSGQILTDTDAVGDDGVAFRSSELNDFQVEAFISFPSPQPGDVFENTQGITVDGNGDFVIPGAGTFPTQFGQIEVAFVGADNPILPLVDIAATQTNGFLTFETDGNGTVYPATIDVTSSTLGVLTVTFVSGSGFTITDASGDPVFDVPADVDFGDTITNDGLIDGDITTGIGDDEIINNLTIDGDIFTGVGDDTITIDGDVFGNIDTGDGIDTITHTGGEIDGDILLGDGDDTFSSTAPAIGDGFTIDAGAGNDVIDGSRDNDIIDGGTGNDTIDGDTGNDNLRGEAGADTLNGEGGNDIIDGGNDADIIDGGTGADTLRGSGGNDTIDGGLGIDTISAGIGNDIVNGGGNNDTILGQGGNDILSGDGGADTLRGGSGNDTLFGGDAADSLFGQGNNDILFGEGGNDTLSGAAGSDQLFGGAGNDTLLGSIGADRLDGGAGNDVLNGGNMDGARDTFVFAVGYDQDRVNSFDQAGTDRLELDEDLWAGAGTLTAQQVVDMFGTLNGSGTIRTLDFGNGDILEVQSGAGIDADTLGADIVFI